MNPIAQERKRGQILIIILLVMVVGLTTGLFSVRNSLTELSTTSNVEESAQAFNAAEAGIEEAIRSASLGQGTTVPVASGVAYSLNVTTLNGASGVVFPSSKSKETKIGDVFTVWLVPHTSDTALDERDAVSYRNNLLDICFSSNTTVPAIAVTLLYRNTSSNRYFTSYVAYDPSTTTAPPRSTNGFRNTTSVGACSGYGYNYRAQLNFNADMGVNVSAATIVPISVRIRPVYADTAIAVVRNGAEVIPSQGFLIDSTGVAGDTSRRIQVAEPYLVPAPFMDNAVYSLGASDLSK